MIFDLDDTLFDRSRAQREIVHRIVREFRGLFAGMGEAGIVEAFFESDRQAVREFEAGGSADTVRTGRSRRFLTLLGLSVEYADRITNFYVNAYSKMDTAVEGAKDVITDLVQSYQLGIVSNGFPDVQYRKLEALGIRHHFDCILLSEELGIRKPDPRIFREAADLLGRNPSECMHVGDSYDSDVIGAREAGLRACWYNPNGLDCTSVHIKPDFEISALNEIFGLLGCSLPGVGGT